MKSTVETISPTRAKLTIEVPFEEFKPNLDAAYKQAASRVNVPGFRKGKVPPAVIDRQLGRGYVLDQAINSLLPEKYSQALVENDLEPLAQPEIELTKFEDNEPIEFTAEVDVKPVIEVPNYEGIEVTVDEFPVTDKDIEEQANFLRERFGTLRDVERAAADGDFVVIDLSAVHDDHAVEEAAVSGMSYQVGRGGLIDGIDEAITGLKAGESKTFPTKFVGGDHAGADVDVTVTVAQVQEQELPEYNDDFAQLASEFDTVGELEEDIRTRLTRGKRLEQIAAARDLVLEKLLEEIEIPLPEGIVKEEQAQRRANVEQQLSWAGLTLDAYLEEQGQTIEEFDADEERRTREGLAAQILLDHVAKKEAFEVDPQELNDYLMRKASQSGQSPQDFMAHMQEHPHHIGEYVSEVLRGKALAKIVESATITDAKGTVVDVKDVLEDGSVAEVDAE